MRVRGAELKSVPPRSQGEASCAFGHCLLGYNTQQLPEAKSLMPSMRLRGLARAALIHLVVASALLLAQSSTQTTLRNPPPDADTALLITLGVGDTSKTKWDGAIEVQNGELAALVGYEMGVGDLIHPPRRWEASMREATPFKRRNHDAGILKDLPGTVYLSPRFYVYLRANPATRLHLKTAQGDVRFRIAEIPSAGSKSFLDGRIAVQHSALPVLVGRGGERDIGERLTDNDYPSLSVAGDGSLWVAWSGFRDGSDRVYAQRIPQGGGAPADSAPNNQLHAVSGEGGDVYRTAIAEDANGAVWVLWSERIDDNWDLYARRLGGRSWSPIERLTQAPQPDMQHRVVRGRDGRLHLVWQGFREGRAGIFYRSRDAEKRLVRRGFASARPKPLTAGNRRSPSTVKTTSTSGGINMGRKATTFGCGRSLPGGSKHPSPSPGPSVSKPIFLSPSTTKTNSGPPGMNPASTGARTGAIRSTSRPTRWGSTRRATFAWRSTRTGGCWNRCKASKKRCLDPGRAAISTSTRGSPSTARIEFGRFFRHRRPAQHNVYYRTPSHHALWEIYGSFYDGRRWSPPVLVPYSTGRADMRIHLARDSEGRLAAAWPTDRRNFRDFVNLLPDVFVARLLSPENGARSRRSPAHAEGLCSTAGRSRAACATRARRTAAA